MMAQPTTYQNYCKPNRKFFIKRIYYDASHFLARIRDKLSYPQLNTTFNLSNIDRAREEQIRNFDQNYTTIAHMYARNL